MGRQAEMQVKKDFPKTQGSRTIRRNPMGWPQGKNVRRNPRGGLPSIARSLGFFLFQLREFFFLGGFGWGFFRFFVGVLGFHGGDFSVRVALLQGGMGIFYPISGRGAIRNPSDFSRRRSPGFSKIHFARADRLPMPRLGWRKTSNASGDILNPGIRGSRNRLFCRRQSSRDRCGGRGWRIWRGVGWPALTNRNP